MSSTARWPGDCISSTTHASSLAARLAAPGVARPAKLAKPAETYKQVQHTITRKTTKSARKRAIRATLAICNVLVLAVVLGFVIQNQRAGSGRGSVASAVSNTPAANPLDQLSSADIALTVARMNSLPESTAINNQAISQAVELTQAPTTTDSVVAKPQVVATSLKSRADIQNYVSQAGDTVSGLATKFGVTSDSIRWSNSLGSSDMVTAGQKLVIPPVTGIVHTVQAGDTVDTLASKYKASATKITAFNDAEISGLKPGEQIIIPDGTQTPTVVPAVSYGSGAASNSFAWGGSSAIYGSNGYDYGYCTWYVATRIAVPANWGNASSWDNLAPLSGWTVSTTPQVGGVAQTDVGPAGEGHVAYVEAVSPDGTMIKYSDMNGLAGFGRVGNSDWVPSTHFQHYIYR